MDIELLPLDPAAPDGAGGFLQSVFWAEFKASFGWKARRFALRSGPGGSGEASSLLVLERKLAAGLSFAYVPLGPELEPGAGEGTALLAKLAEALRPRLGRGCVFLRFDPPWSLVEPIPATGDGEEEEGGSAAAGPRAEPRRPALEAPLRRAAADIQPPDTVILGLGPDEDALLAAMKPKWRYNIRLAGKKGVTVAEEGAASLGDFYRLYVETAARDRIALHPESYYRRLFALAAERPESGVDLRLFVARHEGRALAAIVTLFRAGRATYLYGASSGEKRNLMPAYALQWEAIRAARAAGCADYDFYGIPPGPDPAHPMAGLYRFKTGFGGSILRRAGSWDMPLIPAAYVAYRVAEAARTWYHKDLRKRFSRGA